MNRTVSRLLKVLLCALLLALPSLPAGAIARQENRVAETVASAPTLTLQETHQPVNKSGQPPAGSTAFAPGARETAFILLRWPPLDCGARRAPALPDYRYDGLGNTRFPTNRHGTISVPHEYDASGCLLAGQGGTPNYDWNCAPAHDANPTWEAPWVRPVNAPLGPCRRAGTHDEDNNPLRLHKYLYCQDNSINGSDPSGFWVEIDSNFQFGQDAEPPVVANFTTLRPWVTGQKLSVHGILNYGSNTGYDGLGRLIPDLIDGKNHEIYDVKSWNEVGAGMMKIELYRYAFTMADPDPVQAQLWHSGTTYNYTGPNPVLMPTKSSGKSVYAVYQPTEAGVIPYRLYRVDDDQDKKTIPIPVFDSVTQQNRQSQAAASSGLALAYSSSVMGASLYLNYYSHNAAIGIAGAAFAGLGAMAGIAALNAMEGAP